MCGQITRSYYENSSRKITINKNHLPLHVVGALKVTMETENTEKLRLCAGGSLSHYENRKLKTKINKNHLPLRVVGALKGQLKWKIHCMFYNLDLLV